MDFITTIEREIEAGNLDSDEGWALLDDHDYERWLESWVPTPVDIDAEAA